jgi:hypothetical protein
MTAPTADRIAEIRNIRALVTPADVRDLLAALDHVAERLRETIARCGCGECTLLGKQDLAPLIAYIRGEPAP